MERFRLSLILVGSLLLLAHAPSRAQQPSPQKPDKAFYLLHIEDPVLKELEDRDKKVKEADVAKTKAIQEEQDKQKKTEEDDKQDLRFDLAGIRKPQGPAAFKQAWHQPPVPQFLTGTCWAFSTTSMLESEVFRQTKQKVRLSTMWVVYHEYLLKAQRFVETRGNSAFGEGSESEAVLRVLKSYGVVPEEAYPGLVPSADPRHDHAALIAEMKAYLDYCKANNFWDLPTITASLKLILNKALGEPPQMIKVGGKPYRPPAYLKEVLKLNPDDYVSFISTLQAPFWQKAELKVPDNWWHSKEYHNLPLEDWYQALRGAVRAGATVELGGDVSEPGYNGFEKIAVVPSFDIPLAGINQDSRELRIDNGSTADDHGVQLVGWAEIDGQDWFLVKDSARASRKAPPEGYLYYRGEYLKLKMLSFLVHKSLVKDLLGKFQAERPAVPAAGNK